MDKKFLKRGRNNSDASCLTKLLKAGILGIFGLKNLPRLGKFFFFPISGGGGLNNFIEQSGENVIEDMFKSNGQRLIW